MQPIDVVLAIIPTLSAADRAKLVTVLDIKPQPAAPSRLTPCQKNGHNFRPIARDAGGFFSRPKIILGCTRCGRKKVVS